MGSTPSSDTWRFEGLDANPNIVGQVLRLPADSWSYVGRALPVLLFCSDVY